MVIQLHNKNIITIIYTFHTSARLRPVVFTGLLLVFVLPLPYLVLLVLLPACWYDGGDSHDVCNGEDVFPPLESPFKLVTCV